MTNSQLRDTDRASMAGYPRTGALNGHAVFMETRAVSPVKAPQTGEVRPQAGGIDALLTTRLVDGNKGDVGVRSLGPPI